MLALFNTTAMMTNFVVAIASASGQHTPNLVHFLSSLLSLILEQ